MHLGITPQTSCSIEESNFADQFALDSSTPEDTVIIISDDELVGEDDEVTSAFSGYSFFSFNYYCKMCIVDYICTWYLHTNVFCVLDVEGNEAEVFQVITEGRNEDDSNSSAGDGWNRITELPTELQEKLFSFREERYAHLFISTVLNTCSTQICLIKMLHFIYRMESYDMWAMFFIVSMVHMCGSYTTVVHVMYVDELFVEEQWWIVMMTG